MQLFIFRISCLVCLGMSSVSCAPQGYSYDNHAESIGQDSPTDFAQDLQTPQVPLPEARYLPANSVDTLDTPIVTKRFFIHSAPEDNEEEPAKETYVSLGKSRRNYNVVFIKAPVKAAGKTTLRITPAINEDKTVIYVLSKKPEEQQIETHVLEPLTTTAKPEVYFIKYKTAEEAEHAQVNIQAQYDYLGGSSLVSHEGVPLVHSVVGSLGGDGANGHNKDELLNFGQQTDEITGGSQYLPPRRY